MKNKRIISYPYVLESQCGYSAIVSCIQQDHYKFYVTNPKGYPEFEWFAPNHPDAYKKIITEKLDDIKYDLIKSFLTVTITNKYNVKPNINL